MLFVLLTLLISVTFCQTEQTYRSIEEIEREWENYTTFQKGELLGFCDFLFDEGYYERAILAYFRFLFLYPEDELVPIVYYKIARSYEESGNIGLALEYYERVLSSMEKNSSEYAAAAYRITYLQLKNGNYAPIYEKTENSTDPYILVFSGYAKFSEFQWDEAEGFFRRAQERFGDDSHNNILMPLMDASEQVSNLPMRNRTLAGIMGIIPGGGRAYLRDWYPLVGLLVTATGLSLDLIFGTPALVPTLIPGAALAAIYGMSIWGSIRDVDYANRQIFLKYVEEMKLRYGPENFLDFPEPEFLTLD